MNLTDPRLNALFNAALTCLEEEENKEYSKRNIFTTVKESDYFEAISHVQDEVIRIEPPVLGLEFILEIKKDPVDGTSINYHICMLCNEELTTLKRLYSHLVLLKHRLNYLEKIFPTQCKVWKMKGIELEKNDDQLEEVVLEIERRVGRQKIAVIHESIFNLEEAVVAIRRRSQHSSYFDSFHDIIPFQKPKEMEKNFDLPESELKDEHYQNMEDENQMDWSQLTREREKIPARENKRRPKKKKELHSIPASKNKDKRIPSLLSLETSLPEDMPFNFDERPRDRGRRGFSNSRNSNDRRFRNEKSSKSGGGDEEIVYENQMDWSQLAQENEMTRRPAREKKRKELHSIPASKNKDENLKHSSLGTSDFEQLLPRADVPSWPDYDDIPFNFDERPRNRDKRGFRDNRNNTDRRFRNEKPSKSRDGNEIIRPESPKFDAYNY